MDHDLPDPDALTCISAALDAPLGVRPFRRRDLSGDQVLIVIDARSDEAVLPLLFRQTLRRLLEAGASPSRIRLLFAGGTEQEVTREGVYRRLGWAGSLPFGWRTSTPADESSVVFLGKTRQQTPVYLDRWLDEADLVLCLASVEPDPVFGFTGGMHTIAPGCAGLETTRASQDLLVERDSPALTGRSADSNPIRRDIEEAGAMVPTEVFMVNAVHDRCGGFAAAYAGDPQRVAEASQVEWRRQSLVRVDEAADIVIANAAPYARDLRTCLRAIACGAAALRENGALLVFLAADAPAAYPQEAPKLPPTAIFSLFLQAVSHRRILSYARKTWRNFSLEEQTHAYQILALLKRNRILIFSPNLNSSAARRYGPIEWFAEPSALIARARRLVPSGTAYAFPYAGATWPSVARFEEPVENGGS